MAKPKTIDYFGQALTRIPERRWDAIAPEWLRYIATPQETIFPIEKYEDNGATVSALEDASTAQQFLHEAEIPAVRSTLFSEATYFQFRALNVLSLAERATRLGYPTASVSLAYLSSYLAMRSFLGFLGIGYTEHNSRAYLFDVWPTLGMRTNQGLATLWSPTIIFLHCGARFNHQKHWDVFIHVMRRLRAHGLPDEVVRFFRVLKEHKAFSHRRNSIQYQGEWLFDDLLVELQDAKFGLVEFTSRIDDERNDFDLIIAQHLLLASVSLFQRLAAMTRKLDRRKADLARILTDARHPIFSQGGCWRLFPAQ